MAKPRVRDLDSAISLSNTDYLLLDQGVGDAKKTTLSSIKTYALNDITATSSEINVLDGITATTSELNILDGVTATTSELNILDGVTATASEINRLYGITATTSELNKTSNLFYYVSPTGTGDDTSYLQTAINNNRKIIFKNGDYYVDGQNRLQIPSDTHIMFEEDAVLNVITNNDDDYYCVHFLNVSNILIENIKISGDRLTHTGVTGESGHLIGIAGTSNNIKIINANLTNAWGDGLYLLNGQNIVLENITCDYNRRNGISIISGKDIKVINPYLINQDGVDPQCGIDIEPNTTSDTLENIYVENAITRDNKGAGVSVAIQNLNGSTKNISINIINHNDIGSDSAFLIANLIYNATGSLSGGIKNINPIYSDNVNSAIYIDDYSSENSPNIFISNPVIYNPNTGASSSPLYGSGIVVTRGAGAASTNNIGNVTISNPVIKDDRSSKKMKRGIYAIDYKTQLFKKCLIIDPIEISGVDSASVKEYVDVDSNFIVKDRNNILTLDLNNADLTLGNYAISQITNNSATATRTVTLNQTEILDNEITFRQTSGYGIRIDPQLTERIRPLATGDGKYLESSLRESSITLKKVDSTTWAVTNVVGTWSAEA